MPERDEFFNDAVRIAAEAGKCSTTLIQRKLGLGYARAALIIDQLEAAGVVGPANGNKPRVFTGKEPALPVVREQGGEVSLVPAEESEFEEGKDIITLEREQIEKKILEMFSEANVKIIKRIAYYISKVGHTLEEACKLCRIEPLAFKAQMAAFPILSEFIQLKELEYKSSLMEVVSSKARSNDKVAQWLLESKYPDEFNRKKTTGDGEGGGEYFIAAGIEFVLQTGDSSPIVSKEAGRAFVISRTGGKEIHTNDVVKRINDVLN